jgi:anti-sigma factor RsiW
MAVDPQVAQEVERHRAMRAEVGGAFAGVLDEPVPDRLLRAARKRAKAEQLAPPMVMARVDIDRASLLIGSSPVARCCISRIAAAGLIVAGYDGRVIAGGALAQALSEQLQLGGGAASTSV